MKIVAARVLLLALPLAMACDDGEGPEGDVSTFEVQVYVESGDAPGFDAADQPINATVTVTSSFDDLELVDATGADGTVSFAGIPTGAYTVGHVVIDGADGAELQGSATQTVVAPFAGGDVLTRFIYAFQAGMLTGVVFRDENGTAVYEEGEDSIFADVELILFEGTDTLGTAVATDTTDEDGLYDFGEREAGEYRLIVRAPAGTVVLGANPRALSLAPGETTFHAIELGGDPTGPVITIADARASEIGDTVKVRGTVTAGLGTYRDDSFYVQDSTSGIFVFGPLSVAGIGVGDSVQVVATRWMFRQEAYLTGISVVELGTGMVPEPRTITTTDLNDGLFQGELATLSATVDSITAGDGGFEVWVHDDSGDALVFVDSDTDIAEAEFTVAATMSITGVIGTFDQDDDLTIEPGDYQLKPRSVTDLN